MCPLKREQSRCETQQWVMRRLPTADSIVEIGRKSSLGHELKRHTLRCYEAFTAPPPPRASVLLVTVCVHLRSKKFSRGTRCSTLLELKPSPRLNCTVYIRSILDKNYPPPAPGRLGPSGFASAELKVLSHRIRRGTARHRAAPCAARAAP